MMSPWQDRYDTVCLHVWEHWTKNGLGMGADEQEQSMKSVRDAVTNTCVEERNNLDWFWAALARLGG